MIEISRKNGSIRTQVHESDSVLSFPVGPWVPWGGRMHILVMLVIGVALGLLARPVIPRKGNPLAQTVLSLFTIAVVISGSVLGGFVAYLIGWYRSAVDWRGILVSILGAVVVLWMYRRTMRPLVATSSMVQPPRIRWSRGKIS